MSIWMIPSFPSDECTADDCIVGSKYLLTLACVTPSGTVIEQGSKWTCILVSIVLINNKYYYK